MEKRDSGIRTGKEKLRYAHAVGESCWKLGLVPLSVYKSWEGLSSTHHVRDPADDVLQEHGARLVPRVSEKLRRQWWR